MIRLFVVLAVALAFPATASAQAPETNAPPGNSAIDEYLETVPSASGNRAPRRPTGEPSATPALPPAERAALEGQSEDGAALANLVEATAPAPAPKTASGTNPGAGSTATPPVSTPTPEIIAQAEERSESPLKAAVAAAVIPNDGGGMGVFFPLILAMSVVGVFALAVLRRAS